jgi:enoyl-CoA hydratase/carnithine racemase
MDHGPVVISRDGAIATLTLDCPGTANRLDVTLAAALADACADVGADDQIRVVVLVGAGETFAAGVEPLPTLNARPASSISSLGKPVIAWIEGDCLDMGLELALACDVRVAGPASRFGIRHLAWGSLPSDGGTQRLPRLVGRGQALRLLLTGEVIGADEALRIGLVQQVGDRDAVDALAGRIAASAPIAAAYVREAATAGLDLTLEQGLRLEADLSVLLHTTDDRAEGLRAFQEGRPPGFEGR